ncbi:MAG: transposase [Candidatus Melainabacteria bacterium]|nr:transposase [Candidatus Melainabacteria bacterium]
MRSTKRYARLEIRKRAEKMAAEQARRVRLYGEFMYAARSWDRERRVIARCDYTDEGLKVRYVVTNIRGTLSPTV